ncbi:hypothetical protein L596_019250 [Steinernema carpocapsae]|uniref:Uncharacterized protein n=1 Tax=Steinernema carpocapsae TaxID=34508 RepID=A0A4U5MQW0_STECR|nr:hypothetical protein L596_019250 [Steinernema carpocapsae]
MRTLVSKCHKTEIVNLKRGVLNVSPYQLFTTKQFSFFGLKTCRVVAVQIVNSKSRSPNCALTASCKFREFQ